MPPAKTSMLGLFEAQRALVEPAIAMLRAGNTAFDMLFYDVGGMLAALLERGVRMDIDPEDPPGSNHPPTTVAVLDAIANPEGSILVVDPAVSPAITRYRDFHRFLRAAKNAAVPVETISVTGVGSSALGSAAFAWNIAMGLGGPVAAIVPGYGVADVVQQGLGGWFGFGMHNWLVKQLAQDVLAETAPAISEIGRGLLKSVPGHRTAPGTGAPVFNHGSGSSDVLHALLKEMPGVTRLVGHSKGALVIENAIRGLPGGAGHIEIVTLGCPIDTGTTALRYIQVLGAFDWLGLLNAWGNRPNRTGWFHHSTNPWIPPSIPVADEVAA